MPVERAVSILTEGAGTQWDPAVVEAFLTVLAARPEEIPVYRREDPTPAANPGPVAALDRQVSTEAA
jgi:HD-GYP domain-containing protein (c-di-GMP phosphodiesterase class II)